MKDLNEEVLGAGVGSGNNASVNQQSIGIDLNYRYGVSIQVVITGNPIGTLSLQGSNDYGTRNPNLPDIGQGVVNWTDIDRSAIAVTGSGTAAWNFQGSFYKWVRMIYTATSGSGTLTARANSKGF